VTSLGTTLCCRVPTLEGEKRVRVREGTQTGDRLRLRGLGFPRLGGYQRGDQFIVIRCRSLQP
jgi:DnaJ-class molecular chaperone